MRFTAAAGVALACLLSVATHAAECPPGGYDRPALEALRDAKFAVPDDARRQALALDLTPCLAHRDPFFRDRVAFEAYSTWLRAGLLTVPTRITLLGRLRSLLATEDEAGFQPPFAALVSSH